MRGNGSVVLVDDTQPKGFLLTERVTTREPGVILDNAIVTITVVIDLATLEGGLLIGMSDGPNGPFLET